MPSANDLYPGAGCRRCITFPVQMSKLAVSNHGVGQCSTKSRPTMCLVCGEEFRRAVMRERKGKDGKMHKKEVWQRWKSREIFEHIMDHRRAHERSEEFDVEPDEIRKKVQPKKKTVIEGVPF